MNTLPPFLNGGEFSDIDRHFAGFIAGFAGTGLSGVAAAMLSRNIRLGHICLDLAGPSHFDDTVDFTWPALEIWKAALEKNRAVGGPEDGRPLVLDSAGRLYLRRYWEYEVSLAHGILDRCKDGDSPPLDSGSGLHRRFTVITGGPGTGKTTMVLKLLDEMLQDATNEKLRIALAAPTGKAAARLEETLRGGHGRSPHARLPQSATTLHRLLGWRSDSASFLHNAKNPLPVDIVVVDEASMVPLTMMSKLFDALPAHARVILLGDRHQLASVEPGYVLGDIVDAASHPACPLFGSVVTLEKNFRFGNNSNIFAISNAVREGDADRVFEIVEAGDRDDLLIAPTPSPSKLPEALLIPVTEGYSGYLQAGDPASALAKFNQFRVLSPFRSGPYGTENLNRRIEAILIQSGLLDGPHSCAGRPILITRNDYELRLFNGDVGVIFRDAAGNSRAWFAEQDGTLRDIAPTRLPDHEPAFAMTIHKSQGSEYEKVLLVLPDKENPVITRELLYTGLTRARSRVELWVEESVLRVALERSTRRSSGLRDRLMGQMR